MKEPSTGVLSQALLERVLGKLGFSHLLDPTLPALQALYDAWCRRVPFDNVRKLIHVRSANLAPLPGNSAEDFFEAWLKHGTGGTCWAGAGALHALLTSLGFDSQRAVATMLVATDLPPNHGGVLVRFDSERYLTDSSILYGEPLRLEASVEPGVPHAAWGVRGYGREGRWHVAWRPLNRVSGLECRLESFGSEAEAFGYRYEQTRDWSPFNYEVTARLNCGDEVTGLAFGNEVTLHEDGTVTSTPASHDERMRVLIEDIGLSEEIVSQLPEDVPTPPPPGSKTSLRPSDVPTL